MRKYETLIKILDNICDSAPEKFSSYHIDNKTEDEKNQIRAKAYIHLYLLVKFGIEDFKLRHDFITDGASDGGLDAYYIEAETKTIYLIQSKFRCNCENFTSKEISSEELTAMEIDKILNGDEIGNDGNKYNGKICGFQKKINDIPDLARYKYRVIILANLKKNNLLEKLFSNYEKEIFDYERAYKELVFPMCSSTYYQNKIIEIAMEVEGKIEEVNEKVETSYGNCDVTLLFIPIKDIAKMLNKYKNSVLKFNPRNFLSMSKNTVNKGIKESICEKNKDFTLLNNGITMVCSQYESSTRTGNPKTTKITIIEPQIINGGQTAFTLSKILENKELRENLDGKKVLLKVISICKEGKSEEEYRKFVNKISDATNKQTKIEEADRRANSEIQVHLQEEIYEKYGLFFERKVGEFEDAISKGIIEKNFIIKRDILLKTIWAYNGKCGEARNTSGDKIFTKSVFEEITNSLVSTEVVMYSYLIHKRILGLEKKIKKSEYNAIKWGQAIRYGKFAIISAMAICYPYSEQNMKDESIDTNLQEILSKWKNFEDYVKKGVGNKRYFIEQEEFDNYYKSANADKDIETFFRGTKEEKAYL